MMFTAVEAMANANPIWSSRCLDADPAAQATALESVHVASPEAPVRGLLQRSLGVKNLLRDPPSPVVAFAPEDQQTYVWRGLVRGAGATDPCGPTGLPTPVNSAA